MKLKVPTCSYSGVGHHTATQREEKEGHGHRRTLRVRHWGVTACVVLCPRGTPTEDHVSLPAWLCCSSVPALPALFKNPECSGLSRAPYSGLWRPLTRRVSMRTRASRSLWGLGLGLFCCFFISSFSRRDVQCFNRIPIWLHSFKRCNAIQITLKWGKNAKLCFPFICESLRHVLLLYVLSGLILYCFGVGLPWRHCTGLSALPGRQEAPRHLERSFCSVSAVPPH